MDGCAAPVELGGPLSALLGLEVVLLAELHQATLLGKLIEDLGHLVAQPSSVSFEVLDKEVCDDRCSCADSRVADSIVWELRDQEDEGAGA